jgi:glycosyltransferase involved in cell wall biosynthesis
MTAPRVLVSGLVLAQGPSGVSRHNAELLPRLARRLAEGGGRLALLAPRGGITIDLGEVEILPSDAPGQPAWRRALTESRALRRASRQHGPFDLVHVGHLPTPRGLRVPFTWTIHDLRRSASWLGRRWIQRAARDAHTGFTVSHTVAGELRERFSATNVSVLGNGGDHFTPLPRDPQVHATIVVLGHVQPRKNPELLLHALAHDPLLPPVQFVGAASNAQLDDLRGIAEELGVADRVVYSGRMDDHALPVLLAHAAAVVFPSRLEGFGIGLLEAARARAPIAMSDIPAHREVLGDAVPRFDVDDPAECAKALHAALAEDAATLDQRARDAEAWTWDRVADLWFDAWVEAT